MLGMHGTVYANYAINDADLLLAFGVRFDDRVTGKLSEFAKHGKIVHIDIDPSEINKNKAAHMPIHGDVEPRAARPERAARRGAERRLPPAAATPTGCGRSTHWRETEPLRYADRDDAILPQYAIERLWQILHDRGQLDDTIVTTGVGQHQMWAAQYYHVQPAAARGSPRGGLGTMGFGLPAAMGAQAAHPGQTWSSTSTATAAS